jgi:hypothetical protein
MIEAFPDDTAPRWPLRDRDAIYGDPFRRRVASMGIGEVTFLDTAARILIIQGRSTNPGEKRSHPGQRTHVIVRAAVRSTLDVLSWRTT